MEEVSNKCRLCLKVLKGRGLGKNLWETETGMAFEILEIFQLKLENTNDWPTDACKKCQKQIQDIKLFRNQIQDSQSTLLSLLPNSEKANTTLQTATKLNVKREDEEEGVEILMAPPEEPLESVVYFEESEHEDATIKDEEEEPEPEEEDAAPEEKKKVYVRKKMSVEKPERCQPTRRNKKTFVLKRNGHRPYSIEQEDQLEEQMRSMGLLICNICKIEVDSQKQLHNHFRDVHQTYAYIYCCNGKRRCGLAAFEHVEYHLNGTKFQCHLCNVILRSGYILKNHIAMYHSAPEAPEFKCEQCGRAFKSRGKLNYHMKRHSKPCKCSYCGKGFDNKNHVRRHIERMHEIADRCVCDICGKWFSSHCTLALHLNRHKSQENKKACPHCGKLVADLTQHVNVVHLGTRRGGIIKIPGQPVIYPDQQDTIPTQFTVTLPVDDGDPSSNRVTNIIIQQI